MEAIRTDEAVRVHLLADLLRRFGSARIRVQGSSMLPTLRPGDEVELQSTPTFQIKRGDVVAFQQGERLFVHRVIERCGDGKLLTRGDALTQPDVPISNQQLLGVVESVLRNGKKVELQRSLAARATAAILSRSRICAALFVKFASL